MNATAPSQSDILAAIGHLPPGGALSFEDVSWREYEELLEALGDDGHVSVSYDNGRLEIMSPSDWHDYYKSLLGSLVDVLVEELELDYVAFGSMTLKREKKAKGTEPDECFYITSADRVIGLTGLDLDTAPPPDLAIEVDVAHRSQSKFPIYAALGVPEIWRHRKGQMSFYKLSDGQYVEIPASEIFPFLTPQVLASFLNQDYIQSITAVKRNFRKWVRQHKPA